MGSRRASKSGLNLAMRIIMAYFGLCSATQFGTTDADRGPASAYCTSCDSITAAPLIAFCASTSVVAKSL
jgi:hypothetical protein